MARTKAHTKYLNRAGETVPGVTTLTRQLDKPQLVTWANRLGLQGIDCAKYTDNAATIGTLAHEMILAELGGAAVKYDEYTAEQIGLAQNCYGSYKSWANGKVIEPLLVEKAIVSDTLNIGGSPDFYGYVDGKVTLIDYKTGGIYPEYFIQVCGYIAILQDCGYGAPEEAIILSIPKNGDDCFQFKTYKNYTVGIDLIKHLKAIYELRKLVK